MVKNNGTHRKILSQGILIWNLVQQLLARLKFPTGGQNDRMTDRTKTICLGGINIFSCIFTWRDNPLLSNDRCSIISLFNSFLNKIFTPLLKGKSLKKVYMYIINALRFFLGGNKYNYVTFFVNAWFWIIIVYSEGYRTIVFTAPRQNKHFIVNYMYHFVDVS